MRELSLFSGAGGGLLGTKLLGWKAAGYVEFNSYCQKVLAQRIKDGYLDEAPIFSDIRAFNSEGYAESYKGMVDVITAGFPCQPFSVAGKQLGIDDPRNMWPATIECIRKVRPSIVWLENVSALLVSGYFGTVLGDLAESGYDCRWRILSAGELGAPHKRKRLWVLAYPNSSRKLSSPEERHIEGDRIGNRSKTMGNTSGKRSQRIGTGGKQIAQAHAGQGLSLCTSGDWWRYDPAEAEAESRVGRVADGMANRLDRIKALGNGQVPIVVAKAFELLMNQKEQNG